MDYFNTNKEAGGDLDKSISKANKQDLIIFEYFKSHPDEELTPFEVHNRTGLVGVPLTSIRRAMSNLTEDGKLIKTDSQKLGKYGKKNFCWKLNKHWKFDKVVKEINEPVNEPITEATFDSKEESEIVFVQSPESFFPGQQQSLF